MLVNPAFEGGVTHIIPLTLSSAFTTKESNLHLAFSESTSSYVVSDLFKDISTMDPPLEAPLLKYL